MYHFPFDFKYLLAKRTLGLIYLVSKEVILIQLLYLNKVDVSLNITNIFRGNHYFTEILKLSK